MPKNKNNKLIIGFVLDDGLDSTDGVQQYVLTVGKWLKQQGHEVHYIVGETKRNDIKNIHSMSRNLRVRFNGNILTTPLPASGKNIGKLLSDIAFDVLHVQVPYSPFMAAKVVQRANKQTTIIGTFHILPFGWIQSSGTWILGRLLRRNMRRFDHMISVSPAAKDFAKNVFKVDTSILPNAVDLDGFSSTKQYKKRPVTHIAFLGRLVHRKGCMELLYALRYVLDNDLVSTGFHVDIYGKGPERKALEAYVNKTGLKSLVSFHGYIDENDKPEVLRQADIAVFPSTGAESFGIVLIEAMAAGSGAVIAGNNAGYTSVLSKTPEVLFDPTDTPAFAEVLARYINNPTDRLRLHKIQQELVLQYDVGVIGSKLLELYCKRR